MSYYHKCIKRLKRTRKRLNTTRTQLREMYDEGITLVTFHTTTRTLSLPFDNAAVGACTSAYHEMLSNQRKALKQEARAEAQQWAQWRELNAKDKLFLEAAKLAQAHSRPPVAYPSVS